MTQLSIMSCCGSGSRDGGAKGGGLAARGGGGLFTDCAAFLSNVM